MKSVTKGILSKMRSKIIDKEKVMTLRHQILKSTHVSNLSVSKTRNSSHKIHRTPSECGSPLKSPKNSKMRQNDFLVNDF